MKEREILLPILTAMVRNALQAIFGILIAHQWLDKAPSGESQAQLAVSIAGFVVVLAFSLYQKIQQWMEKRIALALPAGSTSADLAATVKNNSVVAALSGALNTDVPIAKP